MQKKLFTLIIIFLGLSLCACSQSNSSSVAVKQQIMVVTKKSQSSGLFFSGSIAPIKTEVVISPIDGVVQNLYFNYGQIVKKGQLLLKLKSTTLGKNYQQAVSEYLTSKEKYTMSKSNMIGAADLFKAGITSRQTYEAAKSDLNDSYLSFLQAKQTLINLLQSTGISEKDIYLLSIDDEAAVRKALQSPIQTISIYASMDGIALKPEKSSNSDTSSSGGDSTIHNGVNLKSDQVVTQIGQMSGIKIKINADEMSINTIKIGDSASITGAGFPGITLTGKVTAVSLQANTDNNDGSNLPTFPVLVTVNNITPAEQQVIHDGMTAKVQINTSATDEIIIPINAVNLTNNKTYVTILDPNTGQQKQQLVQVGQTTVDGVQIISGLNSGDKIVVSR